MNPSMDHKRKTRDGSKNGAKNEDFSLYSKSQITKIKITPKTRVREMLGKKKIKIIAIEKIHESKNG